MYTGLEKVAKARKVTVSLDLGEGFSNANDVAEALRLLADRVEQGSLVVGLIGNVGHNGRTVGEWRVA